MTTQEKGEQVLVSNEFGAVTTSRVTYFRNKGWFSGGSREDVPVRHITSVRIEKSRSIVPGIVLILIGLATIVIYGLGIIPLAIGLLLLWGSPTVLVNTSGGDLSGAKGFPWQTKNAEAFVEALRKQLFKD